MKKPMDTVDVNLYPKYFQGRKYRTTGKITLTTEALERAPKERERTMKMPTVEEMNARYKEKRQTTKEKPTIEEVLLLLKHRFSVYQERVVLFSEQYQNAKTEEEAEQAFKRLSRFTTLRNEMQSLIMTFTC